MAKKVAIAILAAQMMAGLCQFDASLFGGNSCCKPAEAPCPMRTGCTCCKLNSPSLPSLAAVDRFTVAPVVLTAVVAPRADPGDLRSSFAQTTATLHPAAAHSPPLLYLLNANFRI
jgi:hypothetical protein